MLSLVAALGYGLVSAFVPLLNAEAYAVAAGRTHPIHVVAAVVALAAGQTVGKLVLFEAARRGSARFAGNRTGEDRSARIRARMTGRRSVATVVLAAATLGLPPLAAVSLAAGACGQRRTDFAVLCLVGRTARFAVIALPVAWATT